LEEWGSVVLCTDISGKEEDLNIVSRVHDKYWPYLFPTFRIANREMHTTANIVYRRGSNAEKRKLLLP